MQLRRTVADISETLGTAVYAGATVVAGNVYGRLVGTPARGAVFSGSLFLGVNCKLGPVYVGYGHSEENHSAFYFYLGSSLEAF